MDFPEIKDSYQFKCTLCANCCTGDQKVHLDLYDLYKLARFHKYRHTGLLFSAGLIVLVPVEQGVFLPRIRFKLKPFRFCPFLINQAQKGLCSLHPDHKPLICSLAPVGREVDFKTGTDRYYYVKPAPDCPGIKDKTQNSLSNLQQTYARELGWQKTFFLILHHLQDENWQRHDYLKCLYTFPAHIPFEETLDEFKHRFIPKIQT